jgi:hypothetical protein
MFSISVRYFKRRMRTWNSGWEINVNHLESSSKTPATDPWIPRQNKIERAENGPRRGGAIVVAYGKWLATPTAHGQLGLR